MASIGGAYRAVTGRYATWGVRGRPFDPALAQVRLFRPATRTWFDVVMPLSIMTVLGAGPPAPLTAVLFVVAMVLTHWGLTIVNDLQDLDTDAGSTEPIRALRPLTRGVIPPRTAVAEAAVILVAGVGLAFAVSVATGIVFAVMTLLTLQHELPPARTQSRPVVSQLAGVLGLVVIIGAIGTAVGFDHLYDALPYLVFVAVYMGVAEMLVKDIRDVDNDGAAGKNTTAVRYGAATATRYATLAYLAALGAWLWFALTYPQLPAWTGLGGAAVLAVWIAYTVYASGVLRDRFVKGICISLHVGSIAAFTCVNLLILAGLA